MKGQVDEHGRALIEIKVSSTQAGQLAPITTWIDTAFDGHLVLSSELIEELQLEPLVETEAVLADGSLVSLETFLCFVEWFGQRMPLQVIANDGRFPLLGTGLLDQRILNVNYRLRTVVLD